MPSSRPSAAFVPIAPDLDVHELVEGTDNFEYAPRINWALLEQEGPEKFEKLIHRYVITQGKPLVIDGLAEKLDAWLFNPKWMRDNLGNKGLCTFYTMN
jgi:hypothetical protein